MNRQIWAYLTRVLVCSALLFSPLLLLLGKGSRLVAFTPQNHATQNLLTYYLLVCFVGINHYRFVPRLYLTRQYSRYGLSIMACIFAVVLIPQRIEQWVFMPPLTSSPPSTWVDQLIWRENLFPDHIVELGPDAFQPPANGRRFSPPARPPFSTGSAPPWTEQAIPLFAKFSLIFLLSSVSALASISIQASSRLQQLEVDKLQAELEQLKAQIQPHFLFNTLNSIYALAIRNDARTANTIVKLAEFLRYLIRETGNNHVPLTGELAYIQNYLDLQQARFRESVQISYSLTGSPGGYSIAPLILFTFIENAFKHGVSPDEESHIQITIAVKDEQLSMLVQNKKVTVCKQNDEGGIGIANARSRLNILYPHRHQLTVSNLASDYRVMMTIDFS